MSTQAVKIVTIDNEQYQLVPFFNHDDQQWLYALYPVAPTQSVDGGNHDG